MKDFLNTIFGKNNSLFDQNNAQVVIKVYNDVPPRRLGTQEITEFKPEINEYRIDCNKSLIEKHVAILKRKPNANKIQILYEEIITRD
jgi:hypothetical protein